MRNISLLLVVIFFAACVSDAPKYKVSTQSNDVVDTLPLLVTDSVVVLAEANRQLVYDYDTLVWKEIVEVPGIQLDLKYASTDNFVGEVMYDCARCFLERDAADALLKAKDYFLTLGYGVKLFDCYRPVPVQQKLWDKVPNINYVAPPSKGSMHNRGATVDMTLTRDGQEVDMGTAFDAFTRKSFTFHPFEDTTLTNNRMLLRNSLYQFGYRGIRTEWWHFTYYKSAKQPLSSWLWNCPN